MFGLDISRLAVHSAGYGGALLAASGVLQATGLDWSENAVTTPAQHITMAFFAAALVVLVPAVAALRDFASGRARIGWLGIAIGQLGVATASTVSNVRGVDASWFPAAAVAANALWVMGTLALVIALYRTRRVPRLVALGVVVAYIGSIPLAIVGGGILAGAYWLGVACVLGGGSTDRTALGQPSTL